MYLIKECICWWKELWYYQNGRYNNKRVHLLVKGILILSKCTVQQ